MRALILLAALALLPGCRNVSVDWTSIPEALIDGIGYVTEEAVYRASGESDRAKSYRHQASENPEAWGR
jgi:hypothetical protein